MVTSCALSPTKTLIPTQPCRLTERFQPRVDLAIPAVVVQDAAPTCAPPAKLPASDREPSLSEALIRKNELSKLNTDLPKLRTQTIHDTLRFQRLRSNPYLGDRWPTRSHPNHPCHCLSVAAHNITHAAINAAISYYAKMVALYGPLHNTWQPPVDAWKNDLIINRIKQAQKPAVHDIKAFTGLVMHNDRRVGGKLRNRAAAVTEDYSGHVQPWMDALVHRGMINAAIAAFKEIDERDGTVYEKRRQGPAFFFKRPGTVYSNPFMTRFPCLCKDTAANDVADSVFVNAVNSMSNLSSKSLAWQRSVRTRLTICIARATVLALEEIAEAEDKKHMCSAHGKPPHMHPWMRMKVQSRCSEAASKGLQIIERDLQSMKILGTKSRAEHEEERKLLPSLRGQIMPIPSSRPVTRATPASNPILHSTPSTPMVQAHRDMEKRIYAEKIANIVTYVTLLRLKDVAPAEDYEPAAPRLLTQLSPIAEARDRALKIIASYESIVDEAGNIDSARNLHLKEHGWMNSILIYAIKQAAKRAGKSLRAKLEAARAREGQMVQNRTSGEWAAVGALVNLAERPSSQVDNVE